MTDSSRTPSVALVGPGAIGSTVAALVHETGHRVMVCGHSPRAAIQIRPDDHLGIPGPIRLPGPVCTDPAALDPPGRVDVVLVAVKDTQLDGAAPWLERLCGADTVVCALQNGVEQVARVGRWCPESTVVPAVVWFSAIALPDESAPDGQGGEPVGVIRLRTPVRLVLPDGPAGHRLADVLGGPHLTVDLDPEFAKATWHKLLTNAAAGLMALTGRCAGMFRRPDIADLTRRYLAECLAVARAEGADLGDGVIEEIVGRFAEIEPDQTTSILTDRQHDRPMEWDIRNGVITRKAAEHGIATPISDIVVPLLAAGSDGPG